jgi:hypothetical protein
LLLKNKIIALLVALMLPAVAHADSLLPEIPKAKKNYNEETKCVEPVEEMRKNHMSYIMHQRSETVREGIRTKQHSLKECIDCHNAPAEDGKVARASEPEHFCSTCHTYVGVRIDCFSCHSDKPANTQYRHKLSAENHSEHMNITAHQLTTDTIEVIADKTKESQQ